MLISSAMIPMTTNNSTRVKPRFRYIRASIRKGWLIKAKLYNSPEVGKDEVSSGDRFSPSRPLVLSLSSRYYPSPLDRNAGDFLFAGKQHVHQVQAQQGHEKALPCLGDRQGQA